MKKEYNFSCATKNPYIRRTIKSSIKVFLINVIGIFLVYYASILLHEWAHATVAWILGVKPSPFDIQYGGWFMLHTDENVNYSMLINSGYGVSAALIGIAGTTASLILFIISLLSINSKKVQNNRLIYAFFYWFMLGNLLPLIQYFTVSTFSLQGDVGRFIHGLNISGWWIFIPGTLFVIYSIWRILRIEMPRAYALMPIRTLFWRSIFLFLNLFIMFLFIYAHVYNPLSDPGMNNYGRMLSILSIIAAPILFFVCNPARMWVKIAVQREIDA